MKSESTILGVIGVSVAGIVLLASAFSNNDTTKETINSTPPVSSTASPQTSISTPSSTSSSFSNPSSSQSSSSLSIQDVKKGEGITLVDDWVTNLYKKVGSNGYLAGNIFAKDGTVLEYKTNADGTLGNMIFSVATVPVLKDIIQITWNKKEVYAKLSGETLDTTRVSSINPNKNILTWVKNVPNYTKIYDTYSALANINQLYSALKPGLNPISKLTTASNGTIITAELDTSKVIDKKILSVFGLTGKEKKKVQVQFEDDSNGQLSRIVVADEQGNPVQIYIKEQNDVILSTPNNLEIL